MKRPHRASEYPDASATPSSRTRGRARHRLVPAKLLATAAAGALAFVGVQVLTAPEAHAANAVLVSGTFWNGPVTGVSGGQVAMWAWPNGATLEALPDGASVPLMRVAIATTSNLGAYSLSPNLAGLSPSYFEPDGSVSLMVQAANGSVAQSTDLSAALPGTVAASDGEVALAGAPAKVDFYPYSATIQNSLMNSTPVSNEDGSNDLLTSPTYSLGTGAGSITYPPTGVSVASLTTDSFAGQDSKTCSPYTAHGPTLTKNPEHFVNVYVGGAAAKATVQETSSNSQTLGIGLSINDGPWHAHGTVDRTTDVGDGISRPFTSSTGISNYVNYRHFRQLCTYYASPYDEVRATTFYALEVPALDKSKAMPSWSNCVTYPTDVTLTKDKGSNTRYSAGVDLGFVSLSAEDTFTGNMSITWKTTAKASYCGNTTQGPVGSPQALVRKWS